jgi:hypothetical protein
MDVLEFLGEAARYTLRVFIVIAPLLAWQWVALWGRLYRRRAGGLSDPTILAGMMVGFAMLYVIMPPAALNWNAIVDVGGLWDLTLGEFLDLARSMVLHAPNLLFGAVVYDDARRDLRAWLALAAVIWLIRVLGVWLAGPPLGSSRFALAELATFVASALGTVYLGPLVLWSINRLNFWLILIAILLIQDFRYDDPPIFGRLVGGVREMRPRRHNAPSELLPVPDPD